MDTFFNPSKILKFEKPKIGKNYFMGFGAAKYLAKRQKLR